ncbi:methyltransferase domain-containing protein [Pyxidicoccus fallax]|uniref:Methyltransferase domain-containing protein n=1 Tax=Pyxidicoccus fallax TaxID=394095 RepID=A0A848L7D6_9BACT|nr:methyltransferase domain-containing protein [Pyxidicoccus fallax]NMO14486.1 methyltransferase domain-containing protein [Pyxidicoccus fallax]NPC82947.1 methyltransferase domain-containing protein [Pyxidicoccus fallax]
MWDPKQYSHFRDERKRPFFELLARVDVDAPSHVADLGCGTGDLTRVLTERWQEARVYGVDSSSAMVEEARRRPSSESLRFDVADLAGWEPPAPLDVLVSNAALHWVPDHGALLRRLVEKLAPGGVLAFQIPANFDAPSHRHIDEVRALPRFATKLESVRRGHAGPIEVYESLLSDLGLTVDAWETTYLHVLPGEDAVLEWLLGTTLRPVLAALNPEEGRAFLDTLRPLLRQSYPAHARGTPFRFTRRFVVARRGR